MAQEIINVGSGDNSGNGDPLRTAMIKVQNNFDELYTPVQGFTTTYWFDANDAGTTTTPITHGAGSTTTFLTNDGAGSSTNSYNPNSKAALWDTTTNKFDFTSLKIGDTVEFRIDIKISPAAAQEINLVMDIGEGNAGAYSLNVNHTYFKTASAGDQITAMFRIYMGDEVTRANPARFRLTSIAATTIIVNGWFYQITEV
tara:strand:- start:11593 stop:12192 length:600 start_codon:yes stop_codon:yes gene_type:complete